MATILNLNDASERVDLASFLNPDARSRVYAVATLRVTVNEGSDATIVDADAGYGFVGETTGEVIVNLQVTLVAKHPR